VDYAIAIIVEGARRAAVVSTGVRIDTARDPITDAASRWHAEGITNLLRSSWESHERNAASYCAEGKR
jgi:hypothetical protein